MSADPLVSHGAQLSEDEMLIGRMLERWRPEWGVPHIIFLNSRIVGLGPRVAKTVNIYVTAEEVRTP